MTEKPESATTVVVSPSSLAPDVDYERLVHGDTQHDQTLAARLLDGTRVPTASLCVPAARHTAELASALGKALGQTYALRTTRDVTAIVDQLRTLLTGAAGIAEGLREWMRQAYERGELEGSGDLMWSLASLAGALTEDAGQLRRFTDDATGGLVDKGPGMDQESLAADIADHLEMAGLPVSEIRVFHDQTLWSLGKGRSLVLDPNNMSQTWLVFQQQPDEEWPSAFRSWTMPDTFAHPAQVAKMVVDVLNGEEA